MSPCSLFNRVTSTHSVLLLRRSLFHLLKEGGDGHALCPPLKEVRTTSRFLFPFLMGDVTITFSAFPVSLWMAPNGNGNEHCCMVDGKDIGVAIVKLDDCRISCKHLHA